MIHLLADQILSGAVVGVVAVIVLMVLVASVGEALGRVADFTRAAFDPKNRVAVLVLTAWAVGPFVIAYFMH